MQEWYPIAGVIFLTAVVAAAVGGDIAVIRTNGYVVGFGVV